MTQVFDRYPRGGSERLLALAIADAANDDGSSVFVGVELLASRSAQSVRSVQRQIGAMLADGWLILDRVSSGRRGQTTIYRISPEWIAGGDAVKPADVPDRRTTKSVKQFCSIGGTGDNLSPVKGSELPPSPVDKLSTTGDTQGTWGDTAVSFTGDTAVSPNPSLPFITLKPPLPPVDTGGCFEKDRKTENREKPFCETRSTGGRCETAVGQKSGDASGGGETKPEWRWHKTRRGVERMGEKLGLGRWDEAAFHVGRGELFSRYEARVRAAYERFAEQARAEHGAH